MVGDLARRLSAGRRCRARAFPLSALRFGDFDGNGVTDVISI